MNTNDFSKCKVGDTLWSIQLGDCVVEGIWGVTICNKSYIKCINSERRSQSYFTNGMVNDLDKCQHLYFSNPNIVAPPKPVRLPDYKVGQWIVVWDSNVYRASLRIFNNIYDGNVYAKLPNDSPRAWKHSCTPEELPAILAAEEMSK